jgi:hypothetical protein
MKNYCKGCASMEYGAITLIFSCLLVVMLIGVFIPLGSAWVDLYRLWRRKIYHKLPSSNEQTFKLGSWLFRVIATFVISGIMVWFFWTAFSELYF